MQMSPPARRQSTQAAPELLDSDSELAAKSLAPPKAAHLRAPAGERNESKRARQPPDRWWNSIEKQWSDGDAPSCFLDIKIAKIQQAMVCCYVDARAVFMFATTVMMAQWRTV